MDLQSLKSNHLHNAKIKALEWQIIDPLLSLREDWNTITCALEWAKTLTPEEAEAKRRCTDTWGRFELVHGDN